MSGIHVKKCKSTLFSVHGDESDLNWMLPLYYFGYVVMILLIFILIVMRCFLILLTYTFDLYSSTNSVVYPIPKQRRRIIH